MNTHKHILVYISSSVTLFGLFWICIFGDWHTVNALGDDSSIYLVDFDETAYDLYLKGYYPSDYTYADFRRDSIESMTSHYVATDSNNFSAIVDTIEQDVLQNGWSVIDNFFENAWIDLKSGVVTVAEGFTDDFKHELDGRFKTSGVVSGSPVVVGSGNWMPISSGSYVDLSTAQGGWQYNRLSAAGADLWVTNVLIGTNNYLVVCSYSSGGVLTSVYHRGSGSGSTNGSVSVNLAYSDKGYYQSVNGGGVSNFLISGSRGYPTGWTTSQIIADFFGNSPSVDPVWNGDGYYSNMPMDFSINLPSLPAINWPSISTNNKTKYGVDFPDVDLTIDFQLPDSYYPQTVTYDSPYWLYNTDSTPVDWENVSFDDVTLPEVQLSDGDGSFFQALFNTLPLAFVPILLGVILCYLIFLML